MNIILYDGFSKRKNSTKRPSGGSSVDVKLKENTSIENPSFILSTPISGATYVHVPEWGEYYFVTDCVNLNAGQCELKCECDPMANLKDAIAGTSAFILYDTSSNTEIPDSRLATKTTPTLKQNSKSFFGNFSLQGSIIVTIAGEEQCQSYVLASPVSMHYLIPNAKAQIESLFPAKGADINDTFFDTFIAGVVQIISSGNLGSNIQDIRWIPFTVTGSGTVEIIKNGQYDTGVGADPISQGATRVVTDTVTISIPWQFTDWRNAEPYTQVYVKIPFVGLVNIPASSLKGKSSLQLFTSLDKITGDIAMELTCDGKVIGTYGASTAAKIAIGNSSQNIGNIFNSLIQAVGAAGRLDIGGVITNAANMYTPLTMTVGGVSSAASVGLGGMLEVYTVCHDTTVDPSSVSGAIGTPAMERKTLGSLSGYIQCQNASVNANCRASEREVVDGYLNSGFFFE